MGKKKRYSKEQQQEDLSRDQFKLHVKQYGWILDSFERDLGEDFFVRIYDEGRSSGLTFMVQLKSTTDLSNFKIIDGRVTYRLKVSDLEHWYVSADPVFIVIWDVEKKTGCWISNSDAIAYLDKTIPKWRAQETVTVCFPLENSTDDNGMKRFRHQVADYLYPVISKGKELKITTNFVFPKTPKGKVALTAFEDYHKKGKTFEIEGQFIEKLIFPDWWERIYPSERGKISKLKIVSNPNKEPMPVKIEVFSDNNQSACVDYVELRQSRGGTEEVSFSNEGQDIPLYFSFVFRIPDRRATMSFKVRNPGSNVAETKRLLDFIQAFAAGGTFRVTWLQDGKTMQEAFPKGALQQPPDELVTLIDKLCLIQETMNQILTIPDDWSISDEDISTAQELEDIIQTGHATLRNIVWTLNLDKNTIIDVLDGCKPGKPVQFTADSPEFHSELLGVRIQLGPVKFRATGTFKQSEEKLRKEAAKLRPGETLPVKFINAEIFEEFSDWMPGGSNNQLI